MSWQRVEIGDFFASEADLEKYLLEREIIQSQIATLTRPKSAVVLVLEDDPVSFLAVTFYLMQRVGAVILGTKKWGSKEIEEAKKQASYCYEDGEITPLPQTSFQSEKNNNLFKGDEYHFLIKTGGSSGKIKFARHSSKSLENAANNLASYLHDEEQVSRLIQVEKLDNLTSISNVGGQDRCSFVINTLISLPLYHVSGFMAVVRALITGGKVRFLERGNWKALISENFDFSQYYYSMVPAQVFELLKKPEILDRLQSLRGIFIGGAALSESSKQILREHGLPVYLCYGMTETAAMITVLPKKSFFAGEGGVGFPMPNNTILLSNEQELGVTSNSIFQGYGREAPWSEDIYWTDDEAIWNDEHGIAITGRKNRFINTGGEKVDPLEVETELREITGLDCYVNSVPDPKWGQRVIVILEAEERGGPEIQLWKKKLGEKLSFFKIPKDFYFVSEVPFNALGKLDLDAVFERIIKKN